MGIEPVRVDVLTSLPGLVFGEAWERRQAVDFDGEQAFVVGREDLLLSKKLTGRPRDREHARRLQKPKKSD
jgi:hypothetical protein